MDEIWEQITRELLLRFKYTTARDENVEIWTHLSPAQGLYWPQRCIVFWVSNLLYYTYTYKCELWKLILHFSPFKSDKVFVVGDCRFPINSVILSAFSPVFAAMFRNEMAEKNATEVEIKDVEPHDFADFLSFATFSPQPTRPNRVTFSSIFTKSRA